MFCFVLGDDSAANGAPVKVLLGKSNPSTNATGQHGLPSNTMGWTEGQSAVIVKSVNKCV